MFRYPATRRGDHVDLIHGVPVADPYRWLEDLDATETRHWIEDQNRLSFDFLATIPARDAIRTRMRELWNFEKYGLLTMPVPVKRGGRYFYTYNAGLHNHNILYWSQQLTRDPLRGARALLDPNELAADGSVALAWAVPSPDGKLVACGVTQSGSDWTEWRTRDVETGRDLEDRVAWSKFSRAAWTSDSQGFFYSRYDEPAEGLSYKGANYHHKLYHHRVGTSQDADRLVYSRPDHEDWGFSGEVTEDGRFLAITVWKGTHRVNGIFYLDLRSRDADVIELLRDFDAAYQFLGNDGPVFYVKTDREAPRGRVVAIDIRRPDAELWREVVPEAGEALASASLVGDRIVATYLRDAHSRVEIRGLDGSLAGDVALPGLGTAAGFTGTREDPETFFTYQDFVTPPAVFRLDTSRNRVEPLWQPRGGFDPDAFETRQVFYESKDGTRIPMFLSHRKGLARNGDLPVHLYGYGGFNNPAVPVFSVPNYVWLEMGGVYAQACLRGGGEYGKAWHEAGTRLRKQNVFDDFVAAAEHLIANGITRPARLSIGGRSNGGLLVGAVLLQRPDLFAAALPAVGVLDMLRFHLFTIGWAWVADYGSAEDPEEFRALLAYSPYHNPRPGTSYPATLITTADHDDRVFPAHSFKFAAALQAAQAGDAPVLLRVDTKAGHGAGKPIAMQVEEAVDRWAFIAHVLRVEVPWKRR